MKKIKTLLSIFILLFTGDLLAQSTTNPDSVCFGSTSEMYWINNNPNSTYQWSVDPNIGAVIISGANTNSIIIDWSLVNPGLYIDAITLTETDITSGCDNSVFLDVEVLPLPTATIGTPVVACAGSAIPPLTAIGAQVTWYSDPALTNQVGTGNSYATGQTTPGVYTYYATETLNGCEGPATSITLTIEAAPTADPGLPATICEGDSYTLSNAIVSNNNGLIWTTSGDGQFDNNNILNPIYTPGPNDIINGSVNLTLTANGNSPCSNISSSMVLTITPGAIAEAGPDNNICEDENFTFSSASATNSSLVTWSTSGDGQFDNVNLVNPIYTPGPNDMLNGNVMLTISVNGNGNCTGDTDNMTLFIISLPNPGPIQHN